MIPRSGNTSQTFSGSERHYLIYPGGGEGTLASGSSVNREILSSFTGWDIPGYHKRRRAGELLPYTPWEQIKSDGFWESHLHRYDPSGYQYHTDHDWSHPTSLVPWRYDVASLREQARNLDFSPAITQAAANIYASGHDSLTFLAELHKVVAMFKHAHKSLVNLLTKPPRRRRGAVDTIATFEEMVERHWLEYRYGWRILYFDMVDIAHALADLDDIRKRFSERAGSKLSNYTTTTNSYANPAAYNFTVAQYEDSLISIRGTVTADISPPKFRFNPVLTGWELIRFSFIIDWFIGVGSWLESVSLMAFSTDCKAAGGVKIIVNRGAGLTNVTFNAGNTGDLYYHMENKAEYNVRVPSSVPNLPSVNVRIDVPKVIDLWAIFFGLFEKRPLPSLR